MVVKKISEISIIWPKKSLLKHLSDNTKVSFIPMKDLSQENKTFDTKEVKTLWEVRKWYTYFQDNDVLLAKVTPCFENWKCWIAKNLINWIGFWSSEFIVFRPSKEVISEYIYYFLSRKDFRIEWEKNMWWATWLQRVKKDWLNNIQISLPPLSTQKVIVAKLDEISASIQQAKWAIEQQIEKVDELWKSWLNESISNSSTKISLLGEEVKIIWGWTPSKKEKKYYWWNINWATVRDMNTEYITNTELSITQEGLKNSSSNVVPKEWLVIATRVWLWKVCKLKTDIAINQDLKWILPWKKLITDFLYYFFESIEDKIISAWTGATVKWVKLDFIKWLKVPTPSISQQKQIVSQLNIFQTHCRELNSYYQSQLSHYDQLRASALDQAFSGKLVA